MWMKMTKVNENPKSILPNRHLRIKGSYLPLYKVTDQFDEGA